MKNVKKYSQRLGAGDLYPLFTCMLTARSWDSVNRGIGQTPVTATEVGAPPPAPVLPCPGCKGQGQAWRLEPCQPRVWGSILVVLWGWSRGRIREVLVEEEGGREKECAWMDGGKGDAVPLCPSWPYQPGI